MLPIILPVDVILHLTILPHREHDREKFSLQQRIFTLTATAAIWIEY